MADKDFGIKRINLISSSGTPKITSPTTLNLDAPTVAISTDATIGGKIQSDVIVGTGYSVGIGSTQPQGVLDVNGGVNISGTLNVSSVVTANSFVGDGSNITGISTLNITNYGVGLGGGGGISSVFEDTNPQLGGNLDLNNNDITGTGDIDITGGVTVSGASALNGNITLGEFTSRTITVNGRFIGDLNPAEDNIRNFGTSSLRWKDLYLSGKASIGASVTAEDLYINGNAVLGSSFAEDTVDLNATIQGNLSPSSSSTYDLGNDPGTKWRNLYLTGTASASNLSLTGTGNANVSGIITASAFVGDGSNLVDGKWTLGANGTSDYTFTGIGFTQTTNDPVLYLARGRVYEFVNNSGGSHPFQIRVSNGGAAYSDGVTNNGSATGTIKFEVPFNAPNTLYYQCTNHSSMGNTINVYPTTA